VICGALAAHLDASHRVLRGPVSRVAPLSA
jgi:hypothetical protein